MKKPLASRPMAFLADVHGNLAALEAVLADLRVRQIQDVYVAGDLLYGGDEPLEVWKRLQEVKARCVRGLSDTALATVDPDSLEPSNDHEIEMAERFSATRRNLGDLVVERLRRLPDKIRVPLVDGRELLMVHGSPADPSTDITHDLDDEEVATLLGDDPADIVVCSGGHVAFHRMVDEVEVVALGSVGASPEGRVAHYAVVSPRLDGADVTQLWASY
ncbi:MAG: metallophosphoesterase family protein [Myxococcota bacterium]